MAEEAKERGSRIVTALAEAGARIGLKVALEYPVMGGRVDVAWLWEGPESFPARLPLVGFEVESSWRSRKHIKGDLVNLLELQPALGVIVLLGEGPDVEGTRTFAREMVHRRASRIEVWDENDVLALQGERAREVTGLLIDAGTDLTSSGDLPPSGNHRGKYWALSRWLSNQRSDVVRATFTQIEEAIGLPLPASCRNHVPHWHGYKGSAVARAIVDAGWRAHDVNLTAETVRLERVQAVSPKEDQIGPRS
jgi:hypothetical protein